MDTNINYNFQDRIDSYIMGEMSDQEKREFENEITFNTELKEQYEFTLNVKNGIIDRNKKLRLLNECQDALDRKRRIKKRTMYSSISGMAAAVVIGFFLFNNTGTTSIILPELTADRVELYRGNADLQMVSDLINQKEYDIASCKIDSIEKAMTDEMAQIKEELELSGDQQQLEYIENLHHNMADELMWLKLYTLVGNGDEEGAKNVLSCIRESDSKYKIQADSILNQLK